MSGVVYFLNLRYQTNELKTKKGIRNNIFTSSGTLIYTLK